MTPRIGERGTVALDVKQEVNAVGPPVAQTGSPSFSKREAETSVVLLNNQTLVLGGLIQDKVTLNDRGIPFFKNIPLIGFMFGFKERAVERTELLMLITPKGTPKRRITGGVERRKTAAVRPVRRRTTAATAVARRASRATATKASATAHPKRHRMRTSA